MLHHVSVEVPKGKLTLVLGATGSGKSTLLQSLLSQFEITHGRIWAAKSIAYVPQQPWIMNATVRGNILFFAEEETGRLNEAIRVSQLQADLELFGAGLETEIGEKGINLSGGQKARVSLARAVYASREVYLLDDPLSALDAHVGERVLDDCFLGALAGRTRVLATHQLHVVPKADYIIALGGGSVEFCGSSADFMRSPVYATMAAVAEEITDEPQGVVGQSEVPAPTTVAMEQPIVAATIGSAAGDTSPELHSTQGSSKAATVNGRKKKAKEVGLAVTAKKAPDTAAHLMTTEEKASGTVPWSVYLEYFQFCGGRMWIAIILTMFVITEFLSLSATLWLSLWTAKRFDMAESSYVWIYIGCVLLGTLTVPTRFTFSFEAMRRGTVAMHHVMLHSLSRGTMEFFDTTPLGRIMNRFSRDVDVADNNLPLSMLQLMNCLFSILSSVMVTFTTQPLVSLVLIPCGYIYYRIMLFYNAANREIRRTSSLVKSPLFSLLGETLSGSATIAAYHQTTAVMREALKRLDLVYSCSLLENAANRWIGVRIELLSNCVVTVIVLFGVLHTLLGKTEDYWVSLVSLSLTMATLSTMQLNWLVRQVASVEADMNSVERIIYYTRETPQEELPHCAAREGGDRGPHGEREVDAAADVHADGGGVRRDDQRERPRDRDVRAARAAAAVLDDPAGPCAVRRDGAAERGPVPGGVVGGGVARAGAGGAAGARGVGDGGDRRARAGGRVELQRGAAAADVHGARAAEEGQRVHPDGRGDGEHRPGAGPADPDDGDERVCRLHGDHDCAPPAHGGAVRQDHRDGPRRGGGDGQPARACVLTGCVCVCVLFFVLCWLAPARVCWGRRSPQLPQDSIREKKRKS
ncbi:ATP-binding cassette protein subfamily C member 1 [Lotmaria passim]